MKKYYLKINGATAGPYSVNELRSMNIKPATPVWQAGAANWKTADSIPELQALFNSDPFAISDRTKQFNRPRPRSTSFTQFNFEPEKPEGSANVRIAIIVGILLILVACGAGYYLQKQKEMTQAVEEAQMELDSVNQTQAVDTEATVEEVAPEVSSNVSRYDGEYDNLKGGILSIVQNGGELKVDLKYNLDTGEKCKGEISGSGTAIDDSTVVMTTSDGCLLTLSFRSRYTVSLEESGDCNMYHGKHCLFDGVYYGK